MHKYRGAILVAAGISIFLTVNASSEEQAEEKNQVVKSLQDWSIPKDAIFKFPRRKEFPKEVFSASPDEIICISNRIRPTYCFLTRPNDTHLVAILRINNNGKVTLNPPGIDYGPIPPLPEMTKAQSDQLWGTACSKGESGECTYELSTVHKKPYFVDVVYEKDILKKYRIRTSQSSDNPAEWCQVK